MTRRSALGLLLLAACGARVAPPPAGPRRSDLRIEPLTDLVPAAGLVWLLDLRPKELMASKAMAAGVAEVLPDERFQAFALRHGGVDPRVAKDLIVASYPEATLTMAEVPFDLPHMEAAFAARALSVEGRAVEGDVVRTWGTFTPGPEATREQLAMLGRDAVMLERGHLGPLRAALAFAEGKLHRSLPALRAEPLQRAAALLGDAPARAFAPGPFEGEWASGLGGLLRASTAAAVSMWPRGTTENGAATANLSFRVVLLGAWGDDAPAAADRLRAAFDVLANDPLGKLMGIDHPVQSARTSGGPDALVLEVSLDAISLGRGLRAATAGTVADIMRF